MRHIISVKLQNESGALSRVAGLFSARGYNIESLSVAPTADATVSRLTLVAIGADQVIGQIVKQLVKLVDVVDVVDLTDGPHIERELALVRLKSGSREKLDQALEGFTATVLDADSSSFTLELSGRADEVDSRIQKISNVIEILDVVRTGPVGVARHS